MLDIFTNVLTQVIILLILMALGFILAKVRVLNDVSVKGITNLVLILVIPSVIIKSFADRDFSQSIFKKFLISFILAFLIHILFIALSYLLIRSKDKRREKILRLSAIFSNCGFMSLPLQEAVLGSDGVFFGASFVAVFNLFMWSYGNFLMSGDKKYLLSKKAVLNPGVIGLVVGFLIFVLSIPLPKVIYEPISYLSALNTPLPMIVIGFHLASSNLLKAFKDKACLWAMTLRLIVFPLATLGLTWIFGIRDAMLVSLAISASSPIAAATTMFAEKHEGDTALSANAVSLSTIFSLITMPLIVTLASCIA